MPKSHNEHPHHGQQNHQTHPQQTRKLHHDWRFWVAVVLMLAAMGAYVMTDDESLQPGGGEGPPMPAAAE
jgi:hypothetical protein